MCPPEVRFDGFIEEGTVWMIVIGADTHKGSYTLAAVVEATGRVVATKTVHADGNGMLAAWPWAHGLDGGRVWAIEDRRHVSGRLERCLVGQGERVVRVAPKLMGQSRRGELRPGTSDEIDAVAVARAALTEGIESLPAAVLDERSLQTRLLNDHRDDLVAERTGHKSRLRWHLVELDADGHYARQARAAPIPASSGRRDRVRLNRGGDRHLNCALHRLAVSRARTCPQTRAYLERKLDEGKTRPEAYRCLKRHLARRIWNLPRRDTTATPSIASPSQPTTRRPVMSVNAPIPMPCLT